MSNKVSKSFLKDSHLIAELKLCSIRLIDNAKFSLDHFNSEAKKYY